MMYLPKRHLSLSLQALLLIGLLLPATLLVCPARADFYPIPIIKKMKNVVTVAKSGGQYTDVQTAIDSISDATADNPYLVYIGPGVYTVTSPIQLKAYVTVMGSGRGATILRGAISTDTYVYNTSAIIRGADSATLTRLSVENTGGGNYSVGIYNDSASPVLDNISATASGGQDRNYGVRNDYSSPTMTNVTATASGDGYSGNYGVTNTNASSPTMTNVTASASGGAYNDNYGVCNTDSSSPTMTNVTATASGNSSNRGVSNTISSSPTMTGVTATASGGTYSYGVENISASSPTMINVTATGTGGSTYNRGVYNSNSSPTMTNVTASASGGTTNHGVVNSGSSPVIRHCILEGTTYGVYGGTVALSTVIGGGEDSAVCTSCVDASGTALGTDCN